MVQRRGGAGFLLESMEAVGVGGERDGQDLDRHVTTQPRIARAIDLAHAAGADDRDDFIGAEPLAGGEGHYRFLTRSAAKPGRYASVQ